MGYKDKLPKVEPNQLMEVVLVWEDKKRRPAELTVGAIAKVIEEHGQPTPHAGIARLAAVEYKGQQIWP